MGLLRDDSPSAFELSHSLISRSPDELGFGKNRRHVRALVLHFENPYSPERLAFTQSFLPLGVDVLFVDSEDNEEATSRPGNYDIIAVTGTPTLPRLARFLRLFQQEEEDYYKNTTTVLFQPQTKGKDSKKPESFLRYVDSVILCDSEKDIDTVFHFFDSLLVPSLLNIDIADVRNAARGVGFSFHIMCDDSEDMIAKLPKACAFAKSALLHFSCKQDVTLSEVYSVSRAIASRYPAGAPGNEKDLREVVTPNIARNLFRKVNVKIGLRIDDMDENPAESYSKDHCGRIRLTAVLFGI